MSFRNRFRRGQNALKPINRIKHVVDSQFATAAGTSVDVTLIVSTDTPTLADNDGVETGSTVNGFYIKVEVQPTSSAALPNAYIMFYKNPGGNLTLPQPNVVGVNDNKKFVFHQEMVMMQLSDTGNPRTVFNGVIAIPKGYRRNAPNDFIAIRVLTPGVSANWCLQCHYKEFR